MNDIEFEKIINLSFYPTQSTEIVVGNKKSKIIEYSQCSVHEQLAAISFLRTNSELLTPSQKEKLLSIIDNALKEHSLHNSSDNFQIACENWLQQSLFPNIDKIPYPNPQNATFRFIDLFAGIGGIRLPFTELGGKCVFSSEWDKAAQITYFNNFGEMPFGDITKIDANFIPSHDILLAGFPCQAFSIIGKRKGFADTRGTLFFDVARILEYHHPKAILLENVKQLVTHDKGKTFAVILETLAQLGYFVKWKILNALDFGVPQKRERVIIVGFTNKETCDQFNFDSTKFPYDLNQIIEEDNNIDYKLIASDEIREKRRQKVEGKNVFYPSVWHENKAGNISVLPYACALRTGASYNYLLINGYRRPSSRELLRFQGFPENFKITVPHSEIRRQTGNSVAVPMIRVIAKKIVNLL